MREQAPVQTAPFEIREFRRSDEQGVVEVENAAFPDNPTSVDELRSADKRRGATTGSRRFVAETDGRVVGYAEHRRSALSESCRQIDLAISVHPGHRERGIGSALYDRAFRSTRTFSPESLRAWTRNDLARSISFLTGRGFEEVCRTWDCRLDLAGFDATPYDRLMRRLAESGIEIRTAADLHADSCRDRRIYDLHNAIQADVPRTGPYVPDPFDCFVERNLGPDCGPIFVALRGCEYVGLHVVTPRSEGSVYYVSLTGVRADSRRSGIATGLKVAGISWAQARLRGGASDIRWMKTFNESSNAAIIALNERLGFVRRSATIDFVKTL